MLDPLIVGRAAPFMRDAVGMVSLGDCNNLYGSTQRDVVRFSTVAIQLTTVFKYTT